MQYQKQTHSTAANGSNKKLKGVRRRKWGKYVSEIRVPGTQERLWLGTYATPEAAAVAHDVAVYFLKRPSSLSKLNFPDTLSSYSVLNRRRDLSPPSVQKVASDVAMDVDARNIINNNGNPAGKWTPRATAEAEPSNYDEIGNRDVHDVGFNADSGNSGVSWWEGLGDDDDDFGNSGGSGDQDQALSISIQDYL